MAGDVRQDGEPGEPDKDLLTSGPSGPIAVAAVIIAVWALVLFFRKGWYGGVDAWTPPSVVGVNLSFCAMIMGALAIFRVRRLERQGLVRTMAIAAVVLGMAGPMAYFGQGMHWRASTEGMELRQLSKVAQAARDYARAHDGALPASLDELVKAKLLSVDDLVSPWRKAKPKPLSTMNLPKPLNEYSDYIYLGAGIRGKARPDGAWDLDPKLIVAAAKTESGHAFDKRWNGGESTSIAFASGDARFVRVQEFDAVLKASNEARKKLGLGELDELGNVAVESAK